MYKLWFSLSVLSFLLILSVNTAKAQNRVEIGDIIFDLKGCNLAEQNIVNCFFSITNKGKDSKIWIMYREKDKYATTIFDDFENNYRMYDLNPNYEISLAHDSPVDLSIQFKNVFLHNNKIALLVLGCQYNLFTRFKILFKDIQLNK